MFKASCAEDITDAAVWYQQAMLGDFRLEIGATGFRFYFE